MSLPSRNTSRDQNSSFEWRVPLCAPSFSEEEAVAISKTVRSGWWTSGPETRLVEEEFAAYFGVRHAVALASGTAALHLAFVALGLPHGGEVLTPSLTFVAAANSVLHAGGQPRFADVVSLNTPLVSAETLERAITARTRGICVMHYGGFPCDMKPVMEMARRRGIWVVEDAAHAPGAAREGTPCGKWGDISCFSFFGNKNLTCAEGGMALTDRDDLAERLRSLRSHGMTSLTWDRYRGHSHSYDVTEPGFNYRIDDLRASLLRVQLRALPEMNRLRAERSEWYCQGLSGDSRWIIPFEDYSGISAHHLFVIVLSEGIDRPAVMTALREEGIQSSIHYPPIHQFSFYRTLGLESAGLENTETLGKRLLTLPLYPSMTRGQVDLVCDVLKHATTVNPDPN
jgi:dTDP-4-amino-4,6-dideoxygalactose transaminase